MNDNVIFLGDIHGNWSVISWFLKQRQLEGVQIIQVGDFGVGISPYDLEMPILNNINDLLSNRQSTLYVIRGNHDNPEWFDGNHNLSNIIFLEDFSVMNFMGKNVLFIGGATSIDRTQQIKKETKLREKGKDVTFFFEDEAVIKPPLNHKIPDLTYIDVLVTHTCNMSVYNDMLSKNLASNNYIYDKAKEYNDPDVIQSIMMDHKRLEMFYEQAPNIKEIYFGHFHKSINEIMDGVKYKCLDIEEFYQMR